jgi:polyhydroxybutyrate depolymerase
VIRFMALGVVLAFLGFVAPSLAGAGDVAADRATPSGHVIRAVVTVSRQRRSYRLYVPAGAPPRAGWPLVVALHGGGRQQSGEQMAVATGLDRQADHHRFVIAYPDALGGRFNGGACCNRGVPDVAFIDTVVRRTRRALPIDRRQITATGFSNGGFMAYRLACLRARTFAAVAIVAGVQAQSPCRPARAISVLHIHGANDPRLALRGRFASPTIRGHAQAWRRHAGCRTRSRTVDEQLEQIAWSRCQDSARVRLIILHGYGHGWPGALPPYGQPSDTFSASAHVADFLIATNRR